MKLLQNFSIRRQQMLIIMATSSAALLLACAAFVIYDVLSFQETFALKLNSLATIVGDAAEADLSFDSAEEAEKLLANLKKEQHIVRAYLWRYEDERPPAAGEKPLAVYRRDPADQRPAPAVEAKGRPHLGAKYFIKSAVIIREDQEGKRHPSGRIDLESDLDELYERVDKYVGIMSTVLLASLLVAFALSSSLQRVISDPILYLARVAKAVSLEKNYSIRAPDSRRRDELGQLIAGFNEMLSQIEARDSALESAQSDLERRVSERTQELQQEVADRKRAEVALQQQLTRISLLNSITRAIAARQDLDSVVHVVLKELEDHLPSDFGAVFLYDAPTQTVRTVADRCKDPSISLTRQLSQDAHSLAEAGLEPCQAGQTLTMMDTRTSEALTWSTLAGAGLLSAVAVPLMVERELFGVLVSARRAEKAFSSGECEFLRMLSEQVALAAHQARLHTQLQKAYDELRQTQETVMQQERLRALGQMASGIAHDINNALSPVVVYSDLVLQTEPNLSGSSIKNLEIIRTAGQDIAHIVARMREFYRRRDEKDTFNLLNPNKLINQVIDLTRPRWRSIAQANGVVIDLQTELDRDLPEMFGNESEIREALTNLILNSVDAMPSGGKLLLRSRVRELYPGKSSPQNPIQVLLEVSDSGIGMDEQTRQRCLEPFFSTKGQRGTGLGLAMVYGVMERHEGAIEIESDVGKGTTMRLVFPVKRSPKAGGALANGVRKGLRPLHILCIDDEPLVRDVMKQMLEFGNHRVAFADGGPAGLEQFRASQKNDRFDVVITDLGMPYLDGRQLAARLKSESPETPIIMLTGWGTLMKERDEFPAEVDGLLSKPPKMGEVYDMLRKLTNGT